MPVSREICGRCGEPLPPGNRSCPRCISSTGGETTPPPAAIGGKGNIGEDVFDMAFGIDEPAKALSDGNAAAGNRAAGNAAGSPTSATSVKSSLEAKTGQVKGVAVASPPILPQASQSVPSAPVAAPPLANARSPENQASRNPPDPTLAALPASSPSASSPPADSWSGRSWTTVNIPVLVVLSQGILLGVVGVMAFGMGTWFGRAWEREAHSGVAANLMLSPVKGKCVYRKTSGAEWTPDEGAVVLFVPVRAHVVQPAPLMGLRPGDDANLSRRGLAQLKEWGGARGVCQSDGTYEVSLNRDQEYWIIALSAHKRRAAASPVPLNEVRKAERYFSLAGDGFGPWEVKTAQKRVAGNDWFDFAF